MKDDPAIAVEALSRGIAMTDSSIVKSAIGATIGTLALRT